jgi:phage shock protein E
MKTYILPLMSALLLAAIGSASEPKAAPVNPAIDMEGYLRVSAQAARHRESRRVSEAEFIRMSREPGTLILDARSKAKYDLLHIRGAINLNSSDITVESLRRLLPDKNMRILIYCNNNFKNAEEAFPAKMPAAALNLSTYIALFNYGYRNVYELAPLLEPSKSKLTFESSKSQS